MHVPLLGLLTAFFLTFYITQAKQIYRQPTKRNNGPHDFVTIRDGRFVRDGNEFQLIGTTAYWLPALNSEEDIDNTLRNISAAGFNAVRVWAFNDVTSVPENGTWFQLVANGTTSINNGTNGLQKLDTVVRLAEKNDVLLILSLTNNWNPHAQDSIIDKPIGFTARQFTNTTSRPRNVLSNDYGGMDTYVRELGDIQEHDQFYINDTLINAFKNYTTQVVTRYINSPNVLAWEIANDPRCNSTMTTSDSCNTLRVTDWHADIAQHVRQQDPNHLVSTGNQGFMCPDCPKHFQTTQQPPVPQVSSAPGTRRSLAKPLTKASILKERKAWFKKARQADIAKGRTTGSGIRVRGRWVATPTKRQDAGIGPALDGSTGVDSEDIGSIPGIAFGSFQLFPDQNDYGVLTHLDLPPFNQTVGIGLEVIENQIESSKRIRKPIVLLGFGLVTQESAQAFVPFNSSQALFGPDQVSQAPQQPFGVTDGQRNDAYSQWMLAALRGGLSGVIHYQWGQGNLTVQPGTVVSNPSDETGVSGVDNQTGVSPDDGYSLQGVGQPDFVQFVNQTSQTFGSP